MQIADKIAVQHQNLTPFAIPIIARHVASWARAGRDLLSILRGVDGALLVSNTGV